jgi:hypothetical protein
MQHCMELADAASHEAAKGLDGARYPDSIQHIERGAARTRTRPNSREELWMFRRALPFFAVAAVVAFNAAPASAQKQTLKMAYWAGRQSAAGQA